MLLFLKPILVIFPILALFLSPINASRSFPSTNELDSVDSISSMQFLEAPDYQNGPKCPAIVASNSFCNPSLVHIAMTLDPEYLRGTIAAVHSVIKHTSCPENIFFHFIASDNSRFGMMSSPRKLTRIVESAFPALRFKVYLFKEEMVKSLISSSIREALDNPLNYARSYLADILETCVDRVVYLDSDVIVVDDIEKLWKVSLTGSRVIGAPEYCHTNFSRYFSNEFWIDPELSKNFEGKKACYFNTGVMVMDLKKWREGEYTMQIEKWMRIQKEERRIYELGSLPPFLLVFAGEVEAIEHRWNQHGLGGDNRVRNCRGLHPGPVSLLHWSGKGKPWRRLDEQKPCPVDALWEPYDLYKRPDHLKQ